MINSSDIGPIHPRVSGKPKPWFDRQNNHQGKKIAIIGGGISGAATAYSLAKRGYQVTIYEQNNQLATAASGNYQAILYGNFYGQETPIIELSYSGYRYSHHLIKHLLDETAHEYKECGLIQLYENAANIPIDWLNSISEDFCQLADKTAIEKLAGIKVNYSQGLYFPHGLWLSPQALVKKLTSLPNINIYCQQKIDDLNYINNQWQIWHNGKIIDNCDIVVLCNADSAEQFNATCNINLRKIRGQISIIENNNQLQHNIAESRVKPPQAILCGKGYITPSRKNKFTIGATFDFKNIHTHISNEDHQLNLAAIQSISDSFTAIDVQQLSGQAAIRASTYDYMPLVGPLAIYEKFMKDYAKLAKDKNSWLETECSYHPGLYLNVGHGAKGMLTAPLCGEIIAAYIDNTPLPCSENVRIALHPNRLYIRKLVKGQ